MKTFVLIFIVLVFMTGTVTAQIYPSLDSLQRYLTDRTDMDYTGTDDIDVIKLRRAIFWGIGSVCRDFPALEKLDTVVVDSASEGGALPTDFIRLKRAFLIVNDGLRLPLTELYKDTLFLQRPTILGNLMDLADLFSIKYQHVHAERLLLHPKWRRGDTANILIEYYARDTTTFGTTADSTTIQEEYLEAVIDYAASLIWAMKAEYEKSNYWLARYEKAIVRGNND